jgi:hypothetical protein
VYNFEIDKVYTFNTRAPALLGAQVTRATLKGIIDYSVAITFLNVDLQHRKVYPALPSGTVNDPKKFTYLLFRTESGELTVFAYEWIDDTSIEVVDSTTLTVTLPGVSNSDANKVRDALNLIGFTNFTITAT